MPLAAAGDFACMNLADCKASATPVLTITIIFDEPGNTNKEALLHGAVHGAKSPAALLQVVHQPMAC